MPLLLLSQINTFVVTSNSDDILFILVAHRGLKIFRYLVWGRIQNRHGLTSDVLVLREVPKQIFLKLLIYFSLSSTLANQGIDNFYVGVKILNLIRIPP